MIERVLRGAAIAIAALAILDPPLPVSASTRPRLSIIAQGSSSMDLPGPASSGPQASRRAVAEHVRTALQRALRDDYDITDGRDVSANAAIVIGDRYPEEPLSEAIPVSTVTVSGDLSPNVRIAAIRAPAAVLPATAVPIRVLIEASGVRGSTTTVRMRMGGAEIGRASHAWTADRESWTTAFEGLSVILTTRPLTPSG